MLEAGIGSERARHAALLRTVYPQARANAPQPCKMPRQPRAISQDIANVRGKVPSWTRRPSTSPAQHTAASLRTHAADRKAAAARLRRAFTAVDVSPSAAGTNHELRGYVDARELPVILSRAQVQLSPSQLQRAKHKFVHIGLLSWMEFVADYQLGGDGVGMVPLSSLRNDRSATTQLVTPTMFERDLMTSFRKSTNPVRPRTAPATVRSRFEHRSASSSKRQTYVDERWPF